MKNKWVVYLLALAVFLIGTIEYIISGILHMVATDLGITTASAGALVTAFALSAAIGAPIVIAATIQMDRKKILLMMLSIFILSSFLVYFSPSFEMILLARVIQGISGGAATVIAIAVATRLVQVQNRGQAIGTILMGLSSSLVLGVPAGTFLSEIVGWRILFILIGILTLIPLLVIFTKVPSIGKNFYNRNAAVDFEKQKNCSCSYHYTVLYWRIFNAVYLHRSLLTGKRETFGCSTFWNSITLWSLQFFRLQIWRNSC